MSASELENVPGGLGTTQERVTTQESPGEGQVLTLTIENERARVYRHLKRTLKFVAGAQGQAMAVPLGFRRSALFLTGFLAQHGGQDRSSRATRHGCRCGSELPAPEAFPDGFGLRRERKPQKAVCVLKPLQFCCWRQ